MIVSNSKQFIFVHIPKCGGISITDALVDTIKWNDIILHGGIPKYGSELEPYFDRNFRLNGHQTANIIRETVGIEIWEDYYSFSFVRNPYARIVSLYTWVSKMIGKTRKHLLKEKEWYKWPLVHAYLTTKDFSGFIRSHFFDKGVLSKNQFSWVCDENREKLIVDFIGKTEDLNEDFDKVLMQLGIPDLGLEKLNVSAKKDYRKYYTNQDDLDYIYNKYRLDFDNFGYSRKIEDI